MTKRIQSSLAFAHALQHFKVPMTLPPAMKYNYSNTDSLWVTEDGLPKPHCIFKPPTRSNNAFFSPSENTICMGVNESTLRDFGMTQDPSVLYHEFGHAWVKIMMNQRNINFNYHKY